MVVLLKRLWWPPGWLLLCLVAGSVAMPDPRLREALMRQEASMQTGGSWDLSDAERRLDAKLSVLKEQEMAREVFPPALHFFKARDLIRSSPVYQLLQRMPKGAALHLHDFAVVDAEWLVKNVTYRPHCYVCFTPDQSVRFVFSQREPSSAPGCSPWSLLADLRTKTNTTDLDNSIMGNLTLFTEEDPEVVYPTQEVVWRRFEQSFTALWGLVTHTPVFKDYFYQCLSQFHKDKVMYLELRALLPETYELDGTTHDMSTTLSLYQNISRQFTAEHPDFYGTRIIYSVHRGLEASVVSTAVQQAMKLQREMPEVMAGFDLVGHEDSGRPLWAFREALSLPEQKGIPLAYFFHAGETNNEGTEVDQNILDALLLNTSRIGHGFAIQRHPLAKQLSRKTDVAVEVCPISNQVMKLVSDLRNHPGAALMLEGHPLVISSDDPSMFGASGLSYDFYQAFVGFGGLSSNLATLKQLAVNSIRYSSLSPEQQDKALSLWQRQWDEFVSEN